MNRGATKAAPAKHRGRGRRRPWSPFRVGLAGLGLAGVVVGLVLLLRSGGNSSGPQSQQASVAGSEFRIVAYQGDDQLGGHDTQFSRVTRQGKPVVLNFFAGQCPPCRAEMPGFQRVADEFQGKAIFVGVDVGPYVQLGSHQDAQNLLRELHISGMRPATRSIPTRSRPTRCRRCRPRSSSTRAASRCSRRAAS